MTKNLCDMCIGAVAFWALGYGIAFGTDKDGGANPITGQGDFMLYNLAEKGGLMDWVWAWSYASTSATILSGALAGRIPFKAYAVVCFLVVGISYPLSAHWIWAPDGWLR